MPGPDPLYGTHERHVRALLEEARDAHRLLLARLPGDIARSLPVDAQGIQHAIDYVAAAAGLSDTERHDLIRPHAVNPAVLHARVFGAEGLTDATVIGAFVEGARVRAEALGRLADDLGGPDLGLEVRSRLADAPPPVEDDPAATQVLVATYGAQEAAVLTLAAALDQRG